MTHHLSELSRDRAVGQTRTSSHAGLSAEAPPAIAAAGVSTALAMSMMVALRYLDGHPSRAAAPCSAALPDPALS